MPDPPASVPVAGPPVAPGPGITRTVEHPEASALLTLGIIGLFLPILGPIAWAKVRRALAEIDAAPGRFDTG